MRSSIVPPVSRSPSARRRNARYSSRRQCPADVFSGCRCRGLRSFSSAPWPGSSLSGQRQDCEDDEGPSSRLVADARRRDAATDPSQFSQGCIDRLNHLDVEPWSILSSGNGVIGDHVRASAAQVANLNRDHHHDRRQRRGPNILLPRHLDPAGIDHSDNDCRNENEDSEQKIPEERLCRQKE